MSEHNEDIHKTLDVDLVKEALDDKPWVKNLKMFGAVLRWTMIFVFAAVGYYTYQRDVNAATAVNVNDLKREITDIKQTMAERKAASDEQIGRLMTKDNFQVYYDTLIERLDRIERSVDRVPR